MEQKRNRPLVGKSPTKVYSVTLPPDIAEYLRKFGGGNLSAGIRAASAVVRKVKS